MLAIIDGAIDRLAAIGKAAGTLTLDRVLARHYIAKGCSFVAVGADIAVLARGVDELAASFGAVMSRVSDY
jgi:4-hydroxy-2-oxoheptanedioate aldolase